MNITTDHIALGLIAFLLLVLTYGVKRFFDNAEAARNIELMKFQINTQINPDIMDLFDEFLSDCFDDYILDHPEYIDITYIAQQQEVEMRNGLLSMVGDRISPFLYQKLALYYNESILPDIIARRVYHLVTVFVMDKNTPKQNKEQI